jgi:NAD(P)H-flavin reductase
VATPPRLVRIKCPACPGSHWEIDHDFLYPMTKADFDHWVEVLQENFPDHPRLKELNKRFFPCTPEEAYSRAPHVVEMRGKEILIRERPDSEFARMWFELEGREEVMRFLSKEGGELKVVGPVGGPFEVICIDSQGQSVFEAGHRTGKQTWRIIKKYFSRNWPRSPFRVLWPWR